MGTGAARLKQLTDNMSTIKNDLKELEKLEPKVESVLSLTQILGDASKKVALFNDVRFKTVSQW
jgi:hypothetical protein